jgi:hypothetical protein
MDLVTLSPAQQHAIIGVLGAVATARGTTAPTAADLAVIDAAARHLLGGPEVPDMLATSLPTTLVEDLADPEVAELAFVLASVLSFADITVSEKGDHATLDPARVAVIEELAEQIGTGHHDVKDLLGLTKHHRERVAYDLFRRFLSGTYGEQQTMIATTVQQTKARLGIDVKKNHERWAEIEALPSGTVGAELIRYYHDNGWPYPGTDHHQPMSFAVHDFHHVLGGYATTPAGELQVGAFTAGVSRRPLDCALFFLMWAQLGTGSPSIPGAVGAFESEPFFAALERGARTHHNFIGTGWDPWEITGRDLEEMRTKYGIGPGSQLGVGDPYNLNP